MTDPASVGDTDVGGRVICCLHCDVGALGWVQLYLTSEVRYDRIPSKKNKAPGNDVLEEGQ